MKIDDPVGAISVHGVNGAWGLIAVGLFSDGSYGQGWNGVGATDYLGSRGPRRHGLFYGDSQAAHRPGHRGRSSCIAWNVVVGGLVFYVIGKLVGRTASRPRSRSPASTCRRWACRATRSSSTRCCRATFRSPRSPRPRRPSRPSPVSERRSPSAASAETDTSRTGWASREPPSRPSHCTAEPMIKEILVCLEGLAEHRGGDPPRDRHRARPASASLVGLAIIDEPDIRAGTATSIGGASYKHERDDALVADAHEAGRRLGGAVRSALPRSRRRVPGRWRWLAARRTASSTRWRQHDLTVMGRDANFRFETESDDAKTRDTILHGAERPVLLVPETATPQLGVDRAHRLRRQRRRQAGHDQLRRQRPRARSRNVHVATVDDNGASRARWPSARRRCWTRCDVPAKPHNVVSTLSNIDALFKLAKELEAGLMVMGAFTRSRLRGALLGLGDPRPGREDRDSALPAALMHDASPRPTWAVAPFVVYLLLIAVLPLFFGRLLGAQPQQADRRGAGLGARVVYLFSGRAGGGRALLPHRRATTSSFIALLGALFTISGGIYLRGIAGRHAAREHGVPGRRRRCSPA